jgi:hypothetical protein
MTANFDLTDLAVQMVCPGNVLLYDDLGLPSVMVRLPKMTHKELGMGDSDSVHPLFLVNGKEIDEYYFSKFHNVINNGRAYSLPCQDPKAVISFDTARQACEAKGEGWHINTAMARGFLIRWMNAQGFFPNGNNNYGKHSSENFYKAIPTYRSDSGQIVRTATGTGPLSWYHDNSPAGIADLLGLWDWDGGIRSVCGELQILANNNAADSSHSQAATSTEWKAINAATGELVDPDGAGTTAGTIKMDWRNSKLTYSTSMTDENRGQHGCTFNNIVVDETVGDAAKLLLQDLGFLLYSSDELFGSHYCYFDNKEAERFFYSGGGYYGSACGAASFSGFISRSNASTNIGFRAAFCKLPSE